MRKTSGRMKQRLFQILEQGTQNDVASRIVDRILITLIVLNVVVVVLETVDSLYAVWRPWFLAVEILSVAVFTLEYVLRLWVADEHILFREKGPILARVRYMLTPAAIIDLLAILPSYAGLFVPAADLRFLRLFRLVRFLKLARYSPGINSLMLAMRSEMRALLAALVVMVGLALIGASTMYLLERHIQPEHFGSIPAALWWAVSTLTTVGYGDVVPVTPAGKVLGGVMMFFGLGMFALPIGIIATAFAQEVHRRDFVVRWGMVARAPLFEHLSANEIAEVMKLLQSQSFRAGGLIVAKGEPAHSMYFITAGAVEIDLKDGPVLLETGAFFGEIALMRKAQRSATVRAAEDTQLLVLDATDFHHLMEKQPKIATHIREIARSRLKGSNITPRGDIVADELADAHPVTDGEGAS